MATYNKASTFSSTYYSGSTGIGNTAVVYTCPSNRVATVRVLLHADSGSGGHIKIKAASGTVLDTMAGTKTYSAGDTVGMVPGTAATPQVYKLGPGMTVVAFSEAYELWVEEKSPTL